ncbi:MAG: efflux RND transporter periplasmic adaptor subunit, partial [Chlorobi bacterium]|nr:efflux RND transporter periplasmic adaptor subunit [Chlorobiota bacterium]
MTTINVKKKSQAALLLAVALMFAISFQSCSEEEKAQAKSLEQIQKEEGVPVKTITATQSEFSKSLNFYAKLSGKVESSQTAKIGDVVQKVNAKVGDYVKKGDIIIEMPTNNPNMRYEQAKIGLATLKKTYDRMKVLLDAGEMSQQKFDEVEAQYKVNLKNLESIESLLFIEAPITGTIISMAVHEGDMISLNMGQPTPIFTVAQLGILKSTVWVSESEMAYIKKGMPVWCEYAGETFKGRVTNVYPAMDIRKNAFPVELELNNPQKILKSGTT